MTRDTGVAAGDARHAVVLLSGGLDSATTLAIARSGAMSAMRCRSPTASGMPPSWPPPPRWRANSALPRTG